jgi:FixJ family two-component response regulator
VRSGAPGQVRTHRDTSPGSEIAVKLGLSPKTVRNHVSNILAKLQVADRAEAVERARDAGLGRPRGLP